MPLKANDIGQTKLSVRVSVSDKHSPCAKIFVGVAVTHVGAHTHIHTHVHAPHTVTFRTISSPVPRLRYNRAESVSGVGGERRSEPAENKGS